uniref:DUF3310 domain-containing protein n=1 Tax=Bifidobacterium adolescentis TaxID=1680 RepID=UPI00359C7E27
MIENDPVSNPSHYTNAPFECFDLTREYPFAGGNAIKYVFRHRAKNGVEDLKKAAWYLDHATCEELRPRADRHDMTDFGYRCGLVFSILERHVGTRPWIRFGADSRTPRGHTPHIPDGVPSDRRRDSAARRMEPHSHGSVAP